MAGILVFVAASTTATSEDVRVLLWGLGAAAAIVVPPVGCPCGRCRSTGRSGSPRRWSSGSRCSRSSCLLCWGIGCGIWWNYLDVVGMRPPRPGPAIRGALAADPPDPVDGGRRDRCRHGRSHRTLRHRPHPRRYGPEPGSSPVGLGAAAVPRLDTPRRLRYRRRRDLGHDPCEAPVVRVGLGACPA